MSKVALTALRILFLCPLLWACGGSFHLTVLYDEAYGLQTDAPVMWRGQTIGRVQSIAPADTGRQAVQLRIKQDYREKVTDKSRFFIQDEFRRQRARYIEMVNLAGEGNLLPDGSRVEGSTYLSLQLERGKRQLKTWSELLHHELERWEKELSQLPESEWYRELERQLDYWLLELERAGAETRQYFKEEVLPKLEEAVRDLRRRLRKLGKEKEVEVLHIKLEKLQRI
jgi:hypothetical protein